MARKILLADDSVTAQNMGRKILADAGYEVITVNNGSAALKKIAETKPDLIILDVYMPGYSGLEVCQRLKEAQETARIPVLLTVGKLEPFKPEEARRVRAEGYIVKPFEASELLSTLSKLEDKIVPRPEPSKPGRFARANAAIDEAKLGGRYDKTVSAEEDSGWKDRIGFPSKDKKPAEAEYDDDSTIYNAVNKDLRTVVDRKIAQESRDAKAAADRDAGKDGGKDAGNERDEEARIDLGALAPEGLPKDVTPEEIAALAAAAAQVKGKLAESAPAVFLPDTLPEPVKPVAVSSEPRADESSVPAVTPAITEISAESKTVEEAKKEFLGEDKPKESTLAPVATFALEKPEERSETSSSNSSAPMSHSGVSVPSPTEMMAAIAGLIPEVGTGAGWSAGNGSGSHDSGAPAGSAGDSAHGGGATPKVVNFEPVTMAAATGAASGRSESRWTAVAVALAGDEATLSLEHEMQQAHAAFAAADFAHGPSRATPPAAWEAQPAATAPVLSSPAAPEVPAESQTSLPSSSASMDESPALPPFGLAAVTETAEIAAVVGETALGAVQAAPIEAVRHESSPATVPNETVANPVKDFEKVAASNFSSPAAWAGAEASALPSVKSAIQNVPEPTPIPSMESERIQEPAISQPEPPQAEATSVTVAKDAPAELVAAEHRSEEPQEEPKPELQAEARPDSTREDGKTPESDGLTTMAEQLVEPSSVKAEEKEDATPRAAQVVTSFLTPDSSPHQPANEAVGNEGAIEVTAPEQAVDRAVEHPEFSQATTPAASGESAEKVVAAGGINDMAKKESEISETTAAAWASWRRIRETGDPKAASAKTADAKPAVADVADRKAEFLAEEQKSVPAPEAAMAVAAGAESSPEEVADSADSGEIASIVDSVLAQMRPKIVEEISRKLGKKK